MLFLLFHLGSDRYAIDTAQVREVLPLLRLKQLPMAPSGVAGVLSYRGQPVPVIDLSLLAYGRPAPPHLSTRIVVVNCLDGDGQPRLLGLVAEGATELMRREAGDFVDNDVSSPRAPFLGRVAADGPGFVQCVRVDRLLPADVKANLFVRTAQLTDDAAH